MLDAGVVSGDDGARVDGCGAHLAKMSANLCKRRSLRPSAGSFVAVESQAEYPGVSSINLKASRSIQRLGRDTAKCSEGGIEMAARSYDRETRRRHSRFP